MSELCSLKEAERRTFVSRRTIQRWIKEGSLAKVGDKVRLDDLADLISDRTFHPRQGPRPGRAHYQVTFRNNGLFVPKAQKRLSDMERAEKASHQLERIRDPYLLDLLGKQAQLFAQIRERDRSLGRWTKPEDMMDGFADAIRRFNSTATPSS